MEEYISHVDYKKMMENFKKGTPKGLLKEGWNFDEEGEGHSLWIEKELEDLHLAGNIDTQTLNKALDYVSDNDYELYADNLDANYVLKQVTDVREGNAFTAGLARAKKGQEFKVGSKKVKDTSNYDAPVKESGHGDEPFDFVKSAIESTSGDKISHTEEDSNGRSMYRSAENPNVTYYLNNHEQIIKHDSETGERYSIGDLKHYDEPTHDYEPDTDADYEEPRDDFGYMAGDFNDGEFWEAKVKKLQEIAGVGPEDDGREEDYDEDYQYKRYKRRKQAEKDEEEAENAEREDTDEGLNMPPLQATGQTIITNEDQAPYGFSVLSPGEREQLKEYINHYKTIKSEISKLLEKAGKSGKIMEGTKEEDEKVPAARKAKYHDPTKTPKYESSNLGGDRTGLVMTKAEMWEGEETAHERMDGLVDRKLHDAFQKVTGMIMKELMDDGFDEGDIKNFLQYEIDKKAKEATMSQHDF